MIEMSHPDPQIEFVLYEKANGVEVTPSTIGLRQFNEFNQQVEAFIVGSKRLKLDGVRAIVSEGSYKLIVTLTAMIAIGLEPDLKALERQDSLGEIDPKRAEIVTKWQTRSRTNPAVHYSIRPSGMSAQEVEFSAATDYRIGDAVPWVKVEKYLFGTIMDMGGAVQANVHLSLDGSKETVYIGTNQGYLRDQDQNRLYHKVLVRVEAEQHIKTGKLRHIRLLSFEDYKPGYDEAALDRFAASGRTAWQDVPDADAWVHRLRGGE